MSRSEPVLSNDDAGFLDWATSRRAQLLRTSYLLSGDWHLAEDLVQDTLVKVYVRWRRLVAKGDVDAYARKVLTTTFIDAKRRPWRRESSVADVLRDVADPAAARAIAAVGELSSSSTLAVLLTMPVGQRAVLVLRFLDDLSVEQTAEIVGCSPSAVRSQCSRGLATLRQKLSSQTASDSAPGFEKDASQ